MDQRDIQIQTEKFDGETISALPYKVREEHLKVFFFFFEKNFKCIGVRISDSLELELQTVESCHLGVGN